jgi:orotidine-5'-phosphate decarboxylase
VEKLASFADRLGASIEKHDTPCVVGIDPDLRYLPEEHDGSPADKVRRFCLDVIEAVAGIVPVVKFQSAYFERLGVAGLRVLSEAIAAARSSGFIVILDAKRGDIGNTAIAYADGYLNPNSGSDLAVDALTVSPYLGLDSIEPFVTTAEANGTGIFVCVKTSNAGSADIQDQSVNGRPLYDVFAEALRPWTTRSVGANGYGAVGAVVGGTFPKAASELRSKLASSYFLVPGIGAQGASPKDLLPYFDRRGRGALVSASRSVIFPQHFAGATTWSRDAVAFAARCMVEEVREVLHGSSGPRPNRPSTTR